MNRSQILSPRKVNEISPARKSFDAGKGILCRYCGERYYVRHKCKSQQRFKYLEVEERADQEGIAETFNEDNDMAEQGEEQELVTLSLHSMVGDVHKTSM